MDLDWRMQLVHWTVRAALAGYWLGIVGLLLRRDHLARWVWTAGFWAYVAHVLAAFKFAYGFSHTHAFNQTALNTELALGVRLGAWVWLNYLLIFVWAFDLAWWWLGGHRRYRARRHAAWVIHGYTFCVVFFGSVVFIYTPWRWVYLLGFVALGTWAAWRWFRKPAENQSE